MARHVAGAHGCSFSLSLLPFRVPLQQNYLLIFRLLLGLNGCTPLPTPQARTYRLSANARLAHHGLSPRICAWIAVSNLLQKHVDNVHGFEVLRTPNSPRFQLGNIRAPVRSGPCCSMHGSSCSNAPLGLIRETDTAPLTPLFSPPGPTMCPLVRPHVNSPFPTPIDARCRPPTASSDGRVSRLSDTQGGRASPPTSHDSAAKPIPVPRGLIYIV